MPSFRVGKPRLRLELAANVVLAAGFQLVPWDLVVFDDVGGYDGAGTYTFDRPGLWLFGSQLRRDAVASSSNVFGRSMLNGVLDYSSPDISTTAAQARHFGGLVQVEEGDTYRIEVRLHTTLAATLTAGTSWWWMTRIGPERWT